MLAGIARCLHDLFPVLRGKARVVRAWSGIMGFTADGLPLIGRYEPAPGLTVAAGFNGGGFSWGRSSARSSPACSPAKTLDSTSSPSGPPASTMAR